MKRRTPALTRAFVVPGLLFAVGFAGALLYLQPDATAHAHLEGTTGIEARDASGSPTPAGRDATRSPEIESSAPANLAARAQPHPGAELEGRAAPEQPTPQTPEALQALALTLSIDNDPARRRSAIAALSNLGRSGYEVNTVRETLRLAAADDDASVAERAKEAYDELIRGEDSPPLQSPDSDPALD